MKYSSSSQTSCQVTSEKLLEFQLLLGRVLRKKNHSYTVDSDEFSVKINSKGTGFKGVVYFKPIDTTQFTTITLEQKGDQIIGRFTPFYMIQEEIETDIDSCGGNDAEKSLLLFLSLNLEFTKSLDTETIKRLTDVLQRGIIDIQNE